MMSKLATAVVFLLTVSSGTSFAQTPQQVVQPAPTGTPCTGPNSPFTDYTAARDAAKANPNDKNLKDAANTALALYNACMGKGGLSCNSAAQDFANALSDMHKNCKLDNCMDFAQCGPDDKAGINPNSSTAVQDAKKTCSALSSGSLSKLQDQLAKDKDHLDTLHDKATDAQKDLGTANKDALKDIQEQQKQLSQNQTDYKEKVAELQKTALQQNKDLQQAVAEIQNHIDELTDAANQQVVQQQQASDTMNNAKVAAMMNCQNTASQQVAALQTQVLAAMKSGSYNRGTISSLAQNVGISDRLAWIRVANKYYNYCMASAMTIESFAAANRAYNTAVIAVNQAKASVQQKINTAKGQIAAKAGNGQACGPNNQSEACQNAASNAQQAAAEQADLAQKNQQANQAIADSKQQAATDAQQKSLAANDAQNTYDSEKGRIDRLQQLIDAKLAAGGNPDIDAKDLAASRNLFLNAKEQADRLYGCRDKIGDSNCTEDECKAAKKFRDEVKANSTNPNRPSDDGRDYSDPTYQQQLRDYNSRHPDSTQGSDGANDNSI